MALGTPSVMPGGSPDIGALVHADAPSLSFEFMPPKSEKGERLLWQTIREIEPLHPSFVSVTYGAGGSTRGRTVAITESIATDTTLTPLAHLTAVNHSVAELRNLVGSFAAVGVRNLLAVRGDPPGDPTGEWVRHPEGVEYAEELVSLIRECGDFTIGVAAFPFKHPRSPDVDSDTAHFVRKCRAGADFAITQMFFEADDYFRLRDRVAAAGGGDVPILPELMPVVRYGTVERSEQLSGAPFPPGLRERFDRYRDDPDGLRELGIEHATQLCQRLLAGGAPGIHFITMNRSTASRDVWRNVGVDTVAAGAGV